RKVRRESMLAYGALLAEHGRLVQKRWIKREEVTDDALLNATEFGPVADTITLYESVSGMRPAPITRASLIPIVLASALPLIPVFAIQIPLKQVLAKLLTPLIGL